MKLWPTLTLVHMTQNWHSIQDVPRVIWWLHNEFNVSSQGNNQIKLINCDKTKMALNSSKVITN